MKYKKIMILTIILTFLLSISAVSAVENVTDDVVGVEETTDEVVSVENNNQTIDLATDGSDSLSANSDGTFTDLANEIANSNGELKLSRNYVYDSSKDSNYKEGIVIDKEISINGKGFIINGMNTARAFKVSSGNVVLRNIEFINCSSYGHGGAVYWNGANGCLYDCNFINGHSSNYGGAVYWKGYEGSLSGCTFINSTASGGGAVAWNANEGTLKDCKFENSSVFAGDTCGGAVNWWGDGGILSGCSFRDCSAFESRPYVGLGRAVFWHGSEGSLSGCTFINSTASGEGAVYWDGNGGILSGCSFVNSSITTGAAFYGGSVEWKGSEGTLKDCTFVNCSSGGDVDGGAAIYWKGSDGNLKNCSFFNSSSQRGGGAVYWEGDDGTLKDCSFVNSSSRFRGGAVYWTGSGGTLDGCNFMDSLSYDSGGAVYWLRSYGTVSGCSFVNSFAYDYGGAVCSSNLGEYNTLFDCTFINYLAKTGYAIAWACDEGVLYNCTLMNSVGTKEDAVYGASYENFVFRYGSEVSLIASDVITNYNGGNNVVVILKDNDGHAINNAQIVVELNGDTKTVRTDSNGQAKVSTNKLAPGIYNATISYGGSDKYNPASTTVKITVRTTIDAADVSGTYLNSKVTATFRDTSNNALASKQVTFKINGMDYLATTNSNGVATASVDLGVGLYDVIAINPVNNEQKQFKLIITKANSAISLTAAQSNGVTTLTATLTPAAATGNVVFNVNGEDKSATIKNGVATLTLSDLSSGDYTATARYDGDNNLNADEKTVSFKVIEVETPTNNTDASTGNATDSNTGSNTEDNSSSSENTTDNNGSIKPDVTIPPLDEPSSDGSVTVTLPSDATGTVTLTINGKNEVFNVVNGKANVKLPDLGNGNYPYTITYSGDSKYSSFTSNGTLNKVAPKVAPVITADNVNAVYSAGTYYTIKVTGTDGKPANTVVKITGKISKTLTATNGVAKFKIDQVPGTYKITITALGKSVTKTITVKHLVTLKIVKIKKSAKKLVLQATLGKVNGKYLKNKKITFKFNGKKYTAKTNKKGVAKVTIKSKVLKKLKVGKKVTYQATYLKDTVKKSVKVKK